MTIPKEWEYKTIANHTEPGIIQNKTIPSTPINKQRKMNIYRDTWETFICKLKKNMNNKKINRIEITID